MVFMMGGASGARQKKKGIDCRNFVRGRALGMPGDVTKGDSEGSGVGRKKKKNLRISIPPGSQAEA